MKRTMTIVLLAALALSLSGCEGLDAILSVNVFGGLAGVSPDAIAEAEPADLLVMSGSPSFYEALADDPAAKTAALATIDTALTTAVGADKEKLLVLAATIEIRSTPAVDLIDNVGGVLESLMGGGDAASEEIDPEDLMADLVPPAALESPEAFAVMYNALVNADTYYQSLGEDLGADAVYESDVSAGDIAQTALIAAVVVAIEPPATYTGTDAQYLYELITDPDNTPAPDTFTMPDMETGYLANILAAANFAL